MSKDLSSTPETPKEDGRPKWDNKLQYILSCIGFAVGLGNVWRFPYLCQIHGGGAFLIPYFIALLFEGIPLLHLELALGQYLRKGSIGAWNTISPYLGGVGVGSWMVSVLVSLYYNTVLTWVMWYFINSFQEPLPWSVCPLNENRTGFNEECYESTAVNYFWYRKTLNITPDIAESGTLQWWLILCLATCWGIVYLCTIRGIESTGKAIYVTAIFPYLVLTIFLIQGLTLPGATEGLIYLFTPNAPHNFAFTLKSSMKCADEEQIIMKEPDGFVHWQPKSERKSSCSQPAAEWLARLRKHILGTSLKGHLKTVLVMFLAANVEKLMQQPDIEKSDDSLTFSKFMLTWKMKLPRKQKGILKRHLRGKQKLYNNDATQKLEQTFGKLKTLKNPRVWLDAATQIFFSLSLAFGGLIAFASYNPTKNDCEKDAVTVAIVNSMTSLYASIPVFSVLGFKATTAYWDCLDRNIINIINEFDLPEESIMRQNYTSWISFLNSSHPEKIAGLKLKSCDLQEFLDQSVSGTGLAFIVFTQAIILMPGSQAWAILFFIMLFSLGLSSMFGNIEGVFTPLLELQIIPKSAPKELLSGIICLICFLIALSFTLGSGSYWIDIFDRYAGSVPLLVLAFFEVIGVVYIYKIQRFSKDVEWMTGRKLNLYWQITWRFISPLLLLIVFMAFVTLQMQKPPSYAAWNPKYEGFPMKEDKVYPPWVQAICVLLAALPCMCVPLVALFHLVKQKCRRKDPCLVPPEVFSCHGANSNFSHPKE